MDSPVRSIIRKHLEVVDDDDEQKTERKRRRMMMGNFVFLLDHLPEEVLIQQILLNLPVESLLTLKCVSRYFWNLIASLSFVKLHLQHQQQQQQHMGSSSRLLISTRYVAKCIFDSYDDGICRANIDVIHNYVCNFSADTDPSCPEIVEMNCPFEYTDIRASCNGLLYLHGRKNHGKWTQRTRDITISNPSYIWNPCTKEYKELPFPPPSTLLKDHHQIELQQHSDDFLNDECCSGFCGFGYDRTNDEYKILYYDYLVQTATATTEFKLYTLGTNTWKTITDNPYSSLYFGHRWQRIGMLVNGALHWIMSSEMSSGCATKAKIIAFDMEKEMFRELQKPPPLLQHEEEYYGNLQVLQGCLCVCRFPLKESNNKVDIWMLKDYAVKDSWTKLFRVVLNNPAPDVVDGASPEPEVISQDYFKLLRLCENGEVVIMRQREDLVVYDPINHKARHSEKFEEAVKKYWNYQMDYMETLVSLNSGTYKATAVPKRIQILHAMFNERNAGRDSYLYSNFFVKPLC